MTKQRNTASRKKKAVGRPAGRTTRVSAPVATSLVCSSGSPVVRTMSSTRTAVSHRELIGSFNVPVGTTGLYLDPLNSSVPGYDGNPACSVLFPWLSGMANLFERYCFKSLKFDLVPNQASTAGGRVYMAWDYDYDDTPATTKAMLMSNRLAKEGGVWVPLTLTVDCVEAHRDMPWKYCSNSKRVEAEPRTTNIGFLQLAADTGGSLVQYTWDLWVTYDVVLDLPCLEVDAAVDGYTNAISVPATAVTTSVQSGARGARALVFNSNPSGRAKCVQPGNGTLPALNLDTIATLVGLGQATQAFDCGRCIPSDCIEVGLDYQVTGSTPSAVLSAQNPLVDGYVFASSGAYLGSLGSCLNSFAKLGATSGPANPLDITGTGSVVRSRSNFTWGDVVNVWKTARFVVSVFTTVAAIGAGQVKPWYKTW